LLPARLLWGSSPPTAPVAVAKCSTYGPEVLPRLAAMFDQLGGLDWLVKGKTVAVKLNLTGGAESRLRNLPPELTHWVHPQVIGATVHLLGKAGARRVRLLESAPTAEPLEKFMLKAHWDPGDFARAASGVEFENTNHLGHGTRYVRLSVPGGGMMFRAFDLNHSYQDCDVLVSLAKLKEHATAGITVSMKNLFGITPCTIYGTGAGEDEPSSEPRGFRGMLHNGKREPSRTAPSENDPHSPRDPGYRVPRVVADLVAARPIHLAVVDGIETMAGGEGPWIQGTRPVRPGLLLAGMNCVATDAVAAALMGFDPRAERGTAPFEKCDSTLRLGEQLGIGTRDLSRIEVLGAPVSKARFDFRTAVG
jgi:uncharacterized protein (DUF362 family)